MTEPRTGHTRSISVALTGSGGAGVMTAGGLLLDAVAKFGCYGLQTRSVGPQIRGGEAAALLRLSERPVETHSGSFDVLFALDWNNYSRFAGEILLDRDSTVVTDPAGGPVPDSVRALTANIVEVPLKQIAELVPGGRANMVALGIAAGHRRDTRRHRERTDCRQAWGQGPARGGCQHRLCRGRLRAGRGDRRRGAQAHGARRHRQRRTLAPNRQRSGRASARSGAASVSPPPIRSRRRPKSSNGWHRPWRGSAAPWSRRKTNWHRST